jgi:hypothetical protein
MICDNDFDIALEWQYGHQDHTVLNLVEKYNKKARVILCLNWNGKVPKGFFNLGYFAYLDVPTKMETLIPLFGRAKKAYYTENM